MVSTAFSFVCDIMRRRWVAARLTRFFFQAEDGIRDVAVTGVQTCALPIFDLRLPVREVGLLQARPATVAELDDPDRDQGGVRPSARRERARDTRGRGALALGEIGRASCRERV